MIPEIRKVWFFSREPEHVWKYLTTPELVEKWLMQTDIVAEVGRHFQFRFPMQPTSPYHGEVDCEVLEADAPNRLRYTWNGKSGDLKRSFESVVTWTLTAKNGGTELGLVHSGFGIEEDAIVHGQGWDSCLAKLLTHIPGSEA